MRETQTGWRSFICFDSEFAIILNFIYDVIVLFKL